MSAAEPARYRRSACLVAVWEGADLVVEHFLTRHRAALHPGLALVLAAAEAPRTRAELTGMLGSGNESGDLVDRMIARDLLIEAGGPLDRREQALDEAWRWGLPARYFHFSTRDVPFEPDIDVQRRYVQRLASERPPPSPYLSRGPVAVRLPPPLDGALPAGNLWDVLLHRRTRRRCTGQPISSQQLASILWWTWGVTKDVPASPIGPYVLKTSPSGGARHPVEVYTIVRAVSGVPPGAYHYSTRDHGLEWIAEAPPDDTVVELLAGQPWVREAAALFVMTGVIARSTWKYHHSHAYRVLLLDAGHLGQTFHLVCTALGLAPFTSTGIADTVVDELLGLDGLEEFPVYVAAAGHPAPDAPDPPAGATS